MNTYTFSREHRATIVDGVYKVLNNFDSSGYAKAKISKPDYDRIVNKNKITLEEKMHIVEAERLDGETTYYMYFRLA